MLCAKYYCKLKSVNVRRNYNNVNTWVFFGTQLLHMLRFQLWASKENKSYLLCTGILHSAHKQTELIQHYTLQHVNSQRISNKIQKRIK